MDEERLQQLQAAWWSLRHEWDDGPAGELVAAVPGLVAEVRALRAHVRQARTWAWSEHHQSFSDRWLGTRGPDGQWPEPEWLRSPYEPYRQPWWDEYAPSGPASAPGESSNVDPADQVAAALLQLGQLGVLEDPAGVRAAALAALQRLRGQRDDAQGEAQHWLDLYTVRLTAGHPAGAGTAAGGAMGDTRPRSRPRDMRGEEQDDE